MNLVEIRIFDCEGCGRLTTWPHRKMPPIGSCSFVRINKCRGGENCYLTVRPAEIPAGDLRYLKRFGGNSVDVTDCVL